MAGIRHQTEIKKFDRKGEKTGWTYVEIPAAVANKINKGQKTSYRVKGKLDAVAINKVAIIPMGNGNFILPLNASLRKKIKKSEGEMLVMIVEHDPEEIPINPELLLCLDLEPDARAYFESLPGSHQRYYSKWIESAKTEQTKTKRIARCMYAFANRLSYAEMLHLPKDLF